MTSKPSVPNPDARYEAYSHEALAKLVERNFDPDTAHQVADQWKSVGKVLTELAVDFSVIITGSKEGWTGSAAEGARNALLKVGEFSDTAGDRFTRTSEAVRDQTHAAGEAKTKMPPPVEFDPMKMISEAVHSGNFVDVLALPFAIQAQHAKADAARSEAISVVYARDDALYSATLGMPALEEPPKVTQDQAVVTADAQHSAVSARPVGPAERVGTGVPSAVTGTASATPAASAMPVVGDGTGTTRTSWTAPPAVTPPVATPPVYQHPPAAPPVLPPAMMPPGRRPPIGPVTSPRPPGGVPVGGGRNVAGRPGGVPGVGMPGAGGAGGGSGSPGGARTPGFGPTGGGSFGPAGSHGGHGRAIPGAGGFPAGGAAGGGQGAEDQEHQTKYLIPTDEYFDDTRLVAPETIGE
ncbi:hypothetical protein ACFYOT_26460 [Saccharothrix saharensis]|uniref:hypothetical protein n=1 Tax=Saccharothrix saharensis TaxID=571190 RepID=UPI0036A7A7A1